MTVARLLGDALVARVGRERAIVFGGLLAASGVLVLTLVTPWQVSLAGYVLVGLGCANIVPALFSLAGPQTRMPGALAITAVSTLGFAGILAGPALIGFAANHFGLILHSSVWPSRCCWWRCPRAGCGCSARHQRRRRRTFIRNRR